MRDEHPPGRRGVAHALALALGLAATAGAGGCGKETVTPPPPWVYISPRAQPSDVIQNFLTAYKSRNVVEYAKLLSDDFTFWPDPWTTGDGTLFWTRLQDSTATGNLFGTPLVSNMKLELTYGPDGPDGRSGHGGWRLIEITDTFISLDRASTDGTNEPVTLIVDGDPQRFYLRQGKSPADTLAGSPSAAEWFLVEWHDLGYQGLSGPRGLHSVRPTAVEPTTWSTIKGAFAR